DVGGECVVDPRAQRGRRQVRVELQMRHLPGRVDARIGPSGAVQLELVTPRRVAHRTFDLARNRLRVLLDLPAAVAAAVVFDQQLEAGHYASRASARLAMAVSWNPTPVRSAIVIWSGRARPGMRPAAISPRSARTRSARITPASSACRSSPNVEH